MSHQTAKTTEDCWPEQTVPTANKLRTDDALDFQFVRAAQCSAPLLREIGDFLDSQDTSHPFQLPQWGGSGAHLALLRRQGRLQWFAQCGVVYPAGRLLRPIRALTVYRGPICDDLEQLENGLRRLVDQGRKMRVACIDIAPEWTGGFADSARAALAQNGWQATSATRCSLRLDLRRDPEQLLASFRSTTRYKIRRSEGAGIKVTIARDETEFHHFLRLYVEMASQKQFPAADSKFLLRLFRSLAAERDRGALFLAWESGELKGGILVVRSGVRCWYILGATAKDSKFSSGHLLQWRAIEWAKEKGCFEYDFGGYREGMSSGPAYFKRGFSDRVVHFVPPHRYIVSQRRRRLGELASSLRSRFLLFLTL